MRILAREASVWQDGAFWRRYCALYEPLQGIRVKFHYCQSRAMTGIQKEDLHTCC
ncbi:hypothetical protein SCLCIDRAFT_1213205 [Scleroderma citrinum Foug A]|uniref:Uncharacterized protein n=1 Tax=Scleroderma citrinum Foug A TaxID=1036808 RepID=A0A0C3E9P4_9AGAM|nr:hypothetical protein SCLCIDRAFT_1213205 [Scleroderma citrinum Foug A]